MTDNIHNSKLIIPNSKLYFHVIFCNFVQLFAIFCNFFIRTFTYKSTPNPHFQSNINEYDTFYFFSFKSTQNFNQNRYDSDYVTRLAFPLEIRYNDINRCIKNLKPWGVCLFLGMFPKFPLCTMNF